MVQKKDKMTIEDLAGMMERNFPTKDEMNAKFNELRVEVKTGIDGLRSEFKSEIREVRNGLDDVKIELEEVHDIVKRIDGTDLPNLKRRVTTIETIIKPLRK